jgi:hypothetical protein
MTFITTWKPGQTIKNGRFEILQVLGRGGFGITYLAQDMKNGQKLAIKTLYYLTGNYPSDARIYKHIAPKPPQELNPAISDRVSQAILTAMETDIKKRPQNIYEFRQLLGLV